MVAVGWKSVTFSALLGYRFYCETVPITAATVDTQCGHKLRFFKVGKAQFMTVGIKTITPYWVLFYT